MLLVLTGNDPESSRSACSSPCMRASAATVHPSITSPQPQLAQENVRYIGQPVALVVAETLNQAKDAAELIEVDYEDLPSVTTLEEAIAPGAPAVWDDCPDNIAFVHEAGNKAATEQAIASADHVIRHRMRVNRLTTVTMEPRGCLAAIRSARGPLHAPLHRAGAAHRPPRAGAGNIPRAGDQGARHLRKCRRRLRNERRGLSGIPADPAGGEAASGGR